MSHAPESYYATPAGHWRLWAGLLLAPLGWMLHLALSYALVPLACHSGWTLLLPVVSLVSLAVAGVGGLTAWRSWNDVGRKWPTTEGGILFRSRFMALSGLLTSLLFATVIVAQWVPSFAMTPCHGL